MTPYYSDDSIELWHGDALKVLREMPDRSVNCCVTSPPYFGLRDYGVEGQQGLEESPAEYANGMAAVFAEVRRVLADDGTLWLNIGDSYSVGTARRPSPESHGIPTKNMLGIPWRVAFALQEDGWTLRNAIIWHKPNAMPESVTDRLASRYEHLFAFSKARRYYFDLDAIRENVLYPELIADSPTALDDDRTNYAGSMRPQPLRARTGKRRVYGGNQNQTARHLAATDNTGWKDHEPEPHPRGKNPGDVWTIPTTPFSEAHFATYPLALAERCVKAASRIGDVVLDCYSGSGTTGLAATRLGRRYIGIDLNTDYLDLSLRTRLAQSALIEGPP